MPVKIIKARTKVEAVQKKTLRVAAYCRVSTDDEGQESSFEVQQSFFHRLIEENPDWTLVKIYADQGISGTSLRKRVEFNQMLQDCRDGKIDLILTKSISRFARNTVDCLNIIREMKSRDIPIVFHKEGINTLSAAGEVLITIMASLAQAESESISKNVKLGIQYRFKEGRRIDNPKNMLGYTTNFAGECVIDEEQAAVVRRIYREFLDGKTFGQIGAGLAKDNIKTNRGTPTWAAVNIRYILENEKYAGHALLQKYHKKDVLAHRSDFNDGSVPQYLSENCHPAIIPQFIFNLVQEKLARFDADRLAGRLRRTRNNSGLFGIVRCDGGACSEEATYQHVSANDTWHCYKGSKDRCPVRSVSTTALYRAVENAINLLNTEEMVILLTDSRAMESSRFMAPHIGEAWQPSAVGEELLRIHVVRSLLQLTGQKVESGDGEVDAFYAETMPPEMDVEDIIMRFVEAIVVGEKGIQVRFKGV